MGQYAYDCYCHTNPPCGYCEYWCESCEGTGKIIVMVNSKGEKDYVDGKMTQAWDVCQNCEGLGYKEE